ncbi:hypothetical protein AHMF7605_07735 [Adhaeribacter arboris]|uniref:Transposase IS200-like domain-containing protein n=1 Tax=Adhaeribacter arboris TaxID=2072846 RepID=A0A2T2YD63_9BACT|nr:transposase [Adhaeribacter arboris]PSR53426.1 hypothetical protein AHMF7605_07735 [Adhaeribacter arboris]
MAYNPLIHHRRSIRLKGYDYSQSGAYFITLCPYHREHLFGEIVNGNTVLSEYGQIAFNEWVRTPVKRSNVALDVFVIMPNHLHGIVIINDTGESHSPILDDMAWNKIQLQFNNKGECDSPLRSLSNTVGAIVRGYKWVVTKQINLLCSGQIIWQRNYYEHIIRNEQAYQTISEYIMNNPAKWEEDKFFSI